MWVGRGLWDRVLSLIGFEDEEGEEELLEEAAWPEARRASRRAARELREGRGGADVTSLVGYPERDELSRRRAHRRLDPPGLVALAGRSQQGTAGLVIHHPRIFEEVQGIADDLKSRRVVLLNLEGVERELAQRIVHFLSGTLYAIDGEMFQAARGLLVFAPNGVDVSGAPEGWRDLLRPQTHS